MASQAQILANQRNAQSTTGPRTPEGKAKSSRNSTKLGLFSMHCLVRPDQEAEYHQLSTALWTTLAAQDPLQESLAVEIVRATWRLQRCAEVEGALLDSILETGLDPMQNETTLPIQNAVDRARAQSHGIIRRATAELRRLQTDRQIARETLPGKNPASLGLAGMKEVWNSLYKQFRTKEIAAKTHTGFAPAQETAAALRHIRQVAATLTRTKVAA